MAFNWQIFRTRALTAIIFVAIMLAGLLWNKWGFLLLFSVIHFGCWWEYMGMIEKIHGRRYHPYSKLGFMLAGYGLMLWFAGSHFQINHFGLRDNLSLPVSAAGYIMLVLGLFRKPAVTAASFGSAILGIIYISLSWGMMISFIDPALGLIFPGADHFFWIPLIIIISIWINDTMAYIVGSLIGKTPFSRVSPKKTWEGTLGGIALAVVVTGLIANGVFGLENRGSIYIIPLIAATTGTAGDLLESWIKRKAGVKDSGAIMPGHGGFMDRFDSLLVSTIFVWLYVTLVTT